MKKIKSVVLQGYCTESQKFSFHNYEIIQQDSVGLNFKFYRSRMV